MILIYNQSDLWLLLVVLFLQYSVHQYHVTVASTPRNVERSWNSSAAHAPILALLHIEDILKQLPRQQTIMLLSHPVMPMH